MEYHGRMTCIVVDKCNEASHIEWNLTREGPGWSERVRGVRDFRDVRERQRERVCVCERERES